MSSFGAALHEEVVGALRASRHHVDDCDLYVERFDPVLSPLERSDYHDPVKNRVQVSAYADRLLAAEALVLIYPVWNEGFPAIMKGFFDRVFIPGVSFRIDKNGEATPNLESSQESGPFVHTAPRV